jgi:uncharacterized caspase-like protein
MFTRLLMIGALAVALLSSVSEASAERRVALVIGNSAYAHAANLRNPQNDANDMADALRKLGFEVLLGVDLDQQKFARTIDQFGRMLDRADVGLFFYAGHGLQINERNFLVSTNAQLASEFLIPAETIELDSVVRLMESKATTNIVFLDACRNNPLAEDLRKNLAALNRSVSLGRGLARVEASGRDTLIAFAAAPGQEAADGFARNSPFTTALLKHMPLPGVEVSVMLKQVAGEVRRLTNNNQRPQQLSDMSRMFFFADAIEPAPAKVAALDPNVASAKPSAPVIAPRDDRALDVAFWSAVQAADHCDAVRAYLRRFPNGVFVELATLSEGRLCNPARRVEVQGIDPAKTPDTAATPAGPKPDIVAPAEPAATATPEVKVAALPAAPAETAPAPAPRPTPVDFARNTQLELIRLGCTVEADGDWGASSKKALRLFNKHAHAKLDVGEPTEKVLVALRAKEGRVCPLTCDAGHRAKGDTCVAIKKEPRRSTKRSARKSEPRRQPRHERQIVREQPVERHEPYSHRPVGLMLRFGGGRFRFRH